LKLPFAKLARYPAPIRLLAYIGLLLLLWLPVAAPIALLVKDANTVSLLTMPFLAVVFLLLLPQWGKQVHGESQIFRTYGLVWSRQNGRELLLGLGIGLSSLFAMFWVQSSLGWVVWRSPFEQPSTGGLLRVGLEGAIVGLGVGFAEELAFRGWILDELRRDYSPSASLWTSSLIYAGLHFIKSPAEIVRTLPQFPGLVLLGLACVWAKRSTRTTTVPQGQLGLPIGLHGGLVWGYYIIQVGQLVQYPGHIAEWVTGIDRNPLSGVVGLLSLGVIAAGLKWRSGQQGSRV
jgi:hypothetical protein